MHDKDHSSSTRLLRALAALREDRLDEAERLADLILAEAPNSSGANQLAAAIAYRRGRFAEAERFALACLRAQPRHPPAILIAGRAARAANQPARAAIYFRQAMELAPHESEPALQLCLVQIELGDAAADETLQRLERSFPADAERWSAIGAALRDADKPEAALAAFVRAAATSSDPRHGVDLGSMLLSMSRPQKAIAALRKVLATAPDFAPALEALARALRQAGDLAGAKAALVRLTAARPDDGVAFFLMGLVCEDLQDGVGAIAAYRRSAQLQPHSSETQVNLGIALQQAGELEAALSCYRRAMSLQPDTFGRIAQALPAAKKGQLWLNPGKLRRSLAL